MDTLTTNAETWITSMQLLVPIVVVLGTIIVAIISTYLTYWFTRKMQLEAEWRKDKVKHYSELLVTITETMSHPDDFNETQRRFARASNAVVIIAPQVVTDILFDILRNYRRILNEFEKLKDDDVFNSNQVQLFQQLILAMRKDLRIKPSDDPKTFQYKLVSPLHLKD